MFQIFPHQKMGYRIFLKKGYQDCNLGRCIRDFLRHVMVYRLLLVAQY